MAPNATSEVTGVLNENDAETIDGGLVKDIRDYKKADYRQLKLVWRNIIAFGYLHLAAIYGLWLILSSAKLYTTFFGELEILCFSFEF
jgi:stearoyl-CoA desaturase (Delta-9 desaturase)